MADTSQLIIKKRPSMFQRRALTQQNTTDINSTIKMHETPEVASFRPPRRKSCFVGKEAKKMLLASAEKIKARPSIGGKTGFKGRTLMMVDGRKSIAPDKGRIPLLRANGAPRNMLPRPTVRNNHVRSTPLHMSTPCDPPRSILKNMADKPDRAISSAAKKVDFNSVQEDDGVFPLEESTIPTFNYILPKLPSLEKVDASTNTEEFTSTTTAAEERTPESTNIVALIQQIEKNIIASFSEKINSLSAKIESLEKSGCPCKSPAVPESAIKGFQKYFSQLEDINEDSETVTPTIDEGRRSVTPNTAPQAYNDSETPKFGTETASLSEEEKTAPSDDLLSAHQVEKPLQNEKVSVNESEKENDMDATNDEENLSLVSKKRSSRKKMASPRPMDVTGPCLRSRVIRKRGIPKYLESFDLSPKAKAKPQV